MSTVLMKLTPFESEVVDSILWQVEGLRLKRVGQSATLRILRATLRRIKPRVIARSQSLDSGDRDIDHAIPLRVVCERILSVEDLDRKKLLQILTEWLVSVELTRQEHREILKKCGLSDCMPTDWDKVDRLARYKIAGIQLLAIPNELEGSPTLSAPQ